jgi:cytoplasmic iron level regulating protein YaaA (DUF328/UPF0246 family)
MIKVALVSCCKTKLDYPAEAKDIYTGDLFRKIRGYVEQTCDSWVILSALLGAVRPQRVIEPYDFTLIGKSKQFKEEWARFVYQRLYRNYEPAKHEFYIFAGEDYRKYLVPLLEESGFKVNVPLRGLGIGQQKAWLKKAMHD